MNDFELGWVVGIFEGEGCFWCVNTTTGIGASVSNTDLEMLRKFKRLVGCGYIYEQTPNREVKNTVYVWRTSVKSDVHRVANLLYPYLSPRRQAQADKVLARKYQRQRRTAIKLMP